jgi:uroporphyrinogen-III synthase
MAVLITRPERASAHTAVRLQALGHEVVVEPLLDLHFMPPANLIPPMPDAIIITSSNGARAVARHPDLGKLTHLPVWTVGSRTSMAARELGFTVRGEAPDAEGLGALLRAEPQQHILYIAAENRSADFAVLAPQHNVDVCVVYRATQRDAFSPETVAALKDGRITTVLHYSRRLAGTYLMLAEAADLRAESVRLRHLCLSEHVAEVLRAVNAPDIRVAAEPREDALLELLAG